MYNDELFKTSNVYKESKHNFINVDNFTVDYFRLSLWGNLVPTKTTKPDP